MARSNYINPLLRRTDAGPEVPDGQPPLIESVPAATPAPVSAVPAVHAGPPVTPVSEAPVKFTFYFLPEQLRRLDTLWLRTKLDQRERLNKSEFVRLALDRLMARFDQDPKGVLDELKRQRSSFTGER